jgi:HEAT repeat protein
MMLKIQRFVWGAVFMTVAATALAAADNQAASEDKQRKLIAILQSDAPPQEKAITCKRLAIYGNQEAVPALAPLLTNAQLSSWARIALEVIPGPAADAALREAMDKVQGRLLVGVINSIGVRGDAKAVEALLAKLKETDAEVASAAAVALGRIGGDQALGALQQALPGAPIGVRSAVAQGLILCAEHSLAEGKGAAAAKVYDAVRQADLPKQRLLEATRGAILARQADGLPLLVETLRSPDKAVFSIGLRTARELPGGPVTEALAAEIDRASADRQGPLLVALAERDDPAVLPAIFKAAKTGTKTLRLAAIVVMERLGQAACVPVMLDTVADTDPDLARAAKAALARLPAKQVDDELTARLPQVTGATRRALVELAGQRHVAAAVPELIKASAETDPAIRAAGVKALGETASVADLDALTALLAKAKSADEVAAAEAGLEAACARIPDKDASTDKVLAALPASAAPAKCAFLRALGTIATPKALEAVRTAVASQEPAVHDAAVRVLADWPDTAALPALFEVFRTTQDGTHRVLALRNCVRLLSLGSQSSEQTLKTYSELMASAQRVDDRKMVLAGLAGVADPAALKLVEPFLADAQVQAEAELAMLSIANGLTGSAPAEAKAVATKLRTESKNESARDRAAQILRQVEKSEDFITAWQVSGPYTEVEQGASCFSMAFAPEKTQAKAAWRLLPAGTKADRPYMLDLLAALSGENRAGYARTWVYSDKQQAARLEYGTDDGHKLWLNGKLVHEANRGGAAVPGDFKTPVTLQQGWNALLLKVVQDTGPWEFCLRVRTPAGDKLDGLRVQALPPAN